MQTRCSTFTVVKTHFKHIWKIPVTFTHDKTLFSLYSRSNDTVIETFSLIQIAPEKFCHKLWKCMVPRGQSSLWTTQKIGAKVWCYLMDCFLRSGSNSLFLCAGPYCPPLLHLLLLLMATVNHFLLSWRLIYWRPRCGCTCDHWLFRCFLRHAFCNV